MSLLLISTFWVFFWDYGFCGNSSEASPWRMFIENSFWVADKTGSYGLDLDRPIRVGLADFYL